MNLKCIFERVLSGRSSSEWALIRDAEKKENHPSEMPFAGTLSCRLEITLRIPSREEAQTSSSQYPQALNVIALLVSRLKSVFFHPSQERFFLPFGPTPNANQTYAAIFTKLGFICTFFTQKSANEMMTALNKAGYKCSRDSVLVREFTVGQGR